MTRKSFLKRLSTLPILPALWSHLMGSAGAAPPSPSPASRVRPSDPAWPEPAAWEKLNQLLRRILARILLGPELLPLKSNQKKIRSRRPFLRPPRRRLRGLDPRRLHAEDIGARIYELGGERGHPPWSAASLARPTGVATQGFMCIATSNADRNDCASQRVLLSRPSPVVVGSYGTTAPTAVGLASDATLHVGAPNCVHPRFLRSLRSFAAISRLVLPLRLCVFA